MIRPTHRRVARALRPGGPDVIDIGVEPIPPLKSGEALVRVEAAGLNHAETLLRSGTYVVQVPFPYAVGGEGAGVVVESARPGLNAGARVCWAGLPGSCATYLTAPASMLARLPDELGFEDGARAAVAAVTAEGLARVWPVNRRSTAAVWAAAGAVGRMLVATLADRGVYVIGIASGGDRVQAVRAAGAAQAVDRSAKDVRDAVRAYTQGAGVSVVFDPIGAATFDTSLRLLAARGCLVSYGELSGPPPPFDLHQLFGQSLFVTKYNGLRWVDGLEEFPSLVRDGLELGRRRPAVFTEVGGRYPLDHVRAAYAALESGVHGKILVIPGNG